MSSSKKKPTPDPGVSSIDTIELGEVGLGSTSTAHSTVSEDTVTGVSEISEYEQNKKLPASNTLTYWFYMADLYRHLMEADLLNAERSEEAIKYLIKSGHSVSISVRLFYDFLKHSTSGLHLLLAAGAPVCQLDDNGRGTALHKCVLYRTLEPLQILIEYCRDTSQSLDLINGFDYTALHMAIMISWFEGVCMFLEAGADVMLEGNGRQTAVDLAALNSDVRFIKQVLKYTRIPIEDAVNYNNGRTEQPIMCAIRSGNIECIQVLLDAGAVPIVKLKHYYNLKSSIQTIETENIILHVTTKMGNEAMLDLFLKLDPNLKNLLLHESCYFEDMIPIQIAAYENKLSTFRYLLQKISRNNLQDYAVHLFRLLYNIVENNGESMYKELKKRVISLLPCPNIESYYWKALSSSHRHSECEYQYYAHVAARKGYANLLALLLKDRNNLSQKDNRGDTIISLIIKNIWKPTEFLEKLFDDCIIHRDTEIVIDYSLLPAKYDKKIFFGIFSQNIPDRDSEPSQFGVITDLLKTGNLQNQKRLLAHPLIESFLYLKWKNLSTYYYVMIFLYFMFVMSLSVFTVSTFYYKDKYNGTVSEHPDVPWMWNPVVWKFAIYVTLGIVVMQESSCAETKPKKCMKRFYSVELLMNIAAWILAVTLPQIISVEYVVELGEIDWRRHLATVTLVVAWLNIMIQLSKTPIAGYYIQMFWNISRKIIKILGTFMFLILMFSFCFMLQFHAQVPFEGPWAAVVKTLVMMTSEFDYSDTFNQENLKRLPTSIQFLRVIFVMYLILTAIVLMNMTTGVAVSDIHDLIRDGNTQRLEKQVWFLDRLEGYKGKHSILRTLGLYKWIHCEVPEKVTIKINSAKCCYSLRIKEALINKVQEKRSSMERKAELNKLETNLADNTKNMKEVLSSIAELKLMNLKLIDFLEKQSDKKE